MSKIYYEHLSKLKNIKKKIQSCNIINIKRLIKEIQTEIDTEIHQIEKN